jgi:chromate reductase
MTSFNVLGISGSLRARSYNRSALLAAAELMPPSMRLTITRYDDIPLFNQDLLDQGVPDAVARLAREIAAADGLLIASPEYNFSISGVLKNAVDWLSKIPVQPFKDKPVALLSATTGPLGGARHQYEVRKILGALEALILLKPEIYISMSATKFDADGRLTDAPTRKIMADQMLAFERWIGRMKPA